MPEDHTTMMFDTQRADYSQVVVYLRQSLRTGNQFNGPALISDAGTTVMVPGGYHVSVAPDNSLVIEREDKT